MKNLTYTEIRTQFIDYMKETGHVEIPNTSLVLENDPTMLFTSAGMVPLVPYLIGGKHPSGSRLANVQRCIRTVDINNVGDNSHCTSFEMTGYWSLNDYFKKESIEITMGFLINVLGIDINKLYVSVFSGDSDAPTDKASIQAWKEFFKKHGIDAEVGTQKRIQPFDKSENWWGLEGGGPCGPDSEVFYDTGQKPCGPECNVSDTCGKYIELSNNVFMEYLLQDGKYKPLGRHNVDFGGGLDRWTILSQRVKSFYQTDIYKPIYNTVAKLTQQKGVKTSTLLDISPENEVNQFKNREKSTRIIVDHIKAATWIIMDGVKPGRTQQAYILRRLIRRAVRHGKSLGLEENFLEPVAQSAIHQFSDIYPQLKKQKKDIISTINKEENHFNQTLKMGLKKVESIIKDFKPSDNTFTNTEGLSFHLYETYGFPPEMLLEELDNHSVKVELQPFWEKHKQAFEKHQKKSRTAAKGLFKGGLADTSDNSKKLHTASHLLLAALQKVVNKKIFQQGSNITSERLRLDFPLKRKLTPTELKNIEDLVNQAIQDKLPIIYKEMIKEKALKLVPTAAFIDDYPDTVKVYYIGDPSAPFSVEICKGPHVENTEVLGKFTIIKHESTGTETKRLKAVLA